SQWKEKILSSLLTSQPDENGSQSSKKKSPKRNNGCFNCDGNHHLNECPEPKDFKKIRQRQTEMRNRNSNIPRYHFDGPPSEKKFRAGRISDELRNALGIGRNDIPEYIYRMRRMGFINGYPPGYLKKRTFQHSNVVVIQTNRFCPIKNKVAVVCLTSLQDISRHARR
ncbi:hypothetical protein ANCDUO_19749, partial [Ancylostoma duodenale]